MRTRQRPVPPAAPSTYDRTPGAPLPDHGLHAGDGGGGLRPGVVPHTAPADPLNEWRASRDIREGVRPSYPPGDDINVGGATLRPDAAKNVRFEPTVETVRDSDTRERDALGGADAGRLSGPRM